MSHLDFPKLRDFRHGHGSFVVVELDTAASLDAFGDSAIATAATRIKTAKRLAVVSVAPPFNSARIGMLRLTLYFVGSGIPDPEFAAVPVHPATGNRPSLVPSQPFPFGNAYVHTAYTVKAATISRVELDNPSNTVLSRDFMSTLLAHDFADRQKLQTLRQEVYYCRAARRDDDDVSQSVSATSTSSDSQSIDDTGVVAPQRLPWTHSEPFFRMWMDLSVLDDLELGEPRTIQDELAELRAIQDDAFQTAVEAFQVKRMRVDQWRSTVDSELEGSSSVDGGEDHYPLPSGDDALMPAEVCLDETTPSSAMLESQCVENPSSRRPRVSVGTAPPFNLSITTLGSSWTSLSFSRVEQGRGVEGQPEDARGERRPRIAILLARVTAALLSFRVFPKRSTC
ncbi:hypothetical protein EXIGLDRAFT_833283 [Exidia glandulosa HHB12029]|uniref:Uncharacterized protein n=1 Tax=Exidia glandulosa HHB12029 TaxID=1314781 RepID=A0A165KTL1_EXIGL|nr:hypothetical protein EXIGLDRAFT_833283 [Exidia glandulosa HHB12029]